jgi:hypothetical protein
MAFFITVTALDDALIGALLRAMTLLTTVSASRITTASSWAITGEMPN